MVLTFVTVQHNHVGEITLANANNDDTNRVIRELHDRVNSLCPVIDTAISDNDQHMVARIFLGARMLRSKFQTFSDTRGEQRRARLFNSCLTAKQSSQLLLLCI
jgi:hypothetical protein